MSLEALSQFCSCVRQRDVLCIGPKCDPKSPEHLKTVTNILENEWDTNETAVFNLLQHPILLPKDKAIDYLERGLSGKGNHPKYRLAAAVGLQRIPNSFFDASRWDSIGTALVCTACEPISNNTPWPLPIAAFHASLRSPLIRNTLPLLLSPLWCNSIASEDVTTFVLVSSWKEHSINSFREMIENCLPEKNESTQSILNLLVKQFTSFQEAKKAGFVVHEGPSTTHIPDILELHLQTDFPQCSPSLIASLIATFDAIDSDCDGFITGKEYNDFISRDCDREAGDGTQRMKMEVTDSSEMVSENERLDAEDFFTKRIGSMMKEKENQKSFKPMSCSLIENEKE